MKNIIIVIIVLVLLGGLYFVFLDKNQTPEETGLKQVKNQELGFEFEYPNIYTLVEDTQTQHKDFVFGLMLFNTAEFEEFLESTEAREGPPAIGLRVYENPEKLWPTIWTDRHPLESNIELAFDEPREAVVAGANAVHFVADGLFPVDTYVVAHDSKIYLLTVMYPDEQSTIYQDFQKIVEEFNFLPTSSQTE